MAYEHYCDDYTPYAANVEFAGKHSRQWRSTFSKTSKPTIRLLQSFFPHPSPSILSAQSCQPKSDQRGSTWQRRNSSSARDQMRTSTLGPWQLLEAMQRTARLSRLWVLRNVDSIAADWYR